MREERHLLTVPFADVVGSTELGSQTDPEVLRQPTSHLPAGSNSTLAIAGDSLLAGAGLPLSTTQQPVLVAYKLGAK